MSDVHVDFSEETQETFLRCAHINVHIIACLRARKALDKFQVSQLSGENSLIKRSQMVFEWITESQSFRDSFLRIMENSEQEHVFNLLIGKQDGPHIPLSPMRYNRLENITPKLMLIIRNDEELIARLRAKKAISEIDRQDITQANKEYKKNWNLIEAILRRSDYAFDCFEQALTETYQNNVAKYLHEGQIISVHVNTTQPEKDEVMSDLINAIILEESKDYPSSSEERLLTKINDCNIRPVATQTGQSIVFYFYCQTVDNMIKFTELFISGDLQNMLEVVMNCLWSKFDPEDTEQLKARLSLDDAEVLAVEKFSGIADWMPVELEGTPSGSISRILYSVTTQTEDIVSDAFDQTAQSERATSRYFTRNRAESEFDKITSGSSVRSSEASQEASDDSGVYGWSKRRGAIKKPEEVKPGRHDLSPQGYAESCEGENLIGIKEYVDAHAIPMIGPPHHSAPHCLRPKLPAPKDMFPDNNEELLYLRLKLEQTLKENDTLAKQLAEHRTLIQHRTPTQSDRATTRYFTRNSAESEFDQIASGSNVRGIEASQAASDDSGVYGQLLQKYKSDPVLVQTIRTKAAEERQRQIVGLTSLDKELFIVHQVSSEVEVYDMVNFAFSRRCNLKELICPMDVGACGINKCLFIFDTKGFGRSSEILRVDPNGKLLKKWSTGRDYGCLSVTGEANVIFTVVDKNKLNKYSPDGQLLCEINFSSKAKVFHPSHVIQMTNGNFVVSHGFSDDDIHGVSIVDADGNLRRAFGGKRGSAIGQVNLPFHLTVDEYGFVMVVDRLNKRVLLLDSDLNLKREILSKEKHGLRDPWRILLDESSGLLLVTDNELNNERILIFTVKN